MCQLLGVCSNKEVNIDFSLRGFKHRGKINPHGWGFAFLKENKWEIIKKPSSLSEEEIKDNQFQFRSKIIIGHVRLASCGSQIHKNTHPFKIENWVFAHNGTLKKIKTYSLKKYKPDGDTDSEHAFCYLLENIKNENIIDSIKNLAEEIKKLGRFNFLLSDGEYLYAYGHDSLFYVKRAAPFSEVALKDEDYSVNLGEIKEPDEKAIIVATEPITDKEEWIKINGLKVFKEGKEI